MTCDRPIICGGDYNCIESILLDKSTLSNCGTEGFAELKTVCDRFELVDVFRDKYPNKISFSFERGEIKSRLDRFYISKALVKDVSNIVYIPCPYSDHN